MSQDAKKIIDFVAYAEKLKCEIRHASRSDNQRESVAEHCWRLSLMLMLVFPHLKIKVDLLKTLKMAIIHDLVEIESRDVPLLKHINNQAAKRAKSSKEKRAMSKIRKMLGRDGKEISALWLEHEELKTNEAKVLKALDRLEGELQFLHESVTKFTKKDKKAIEILLQETTDLAKIDPFLEELDRLSFADRKNRIKC